MPKLLVTMAVLVVVTLISVAPALAQNWTRGYTRRDGTVVQPYQRTAPDSNPYNNYSYPGNFHPNTGQITGGNQDTYLQRYNNPTLPGLSNPGSIYQPYKSDLYTTPRRWR